MVKVLPLQLQTHLTLLPIDPLQQLLLLVVVEVVHLTTAVLVVVGPVVQEEEKTLAAVLTSLVVLRSKAAAVAAVLVQAVVEFGMVDKVVAVPRDGDLVVAVVTVGMVVVALVETTRTVTVEAVVPQDIFPTLLELQTLTDTLKLVLHQPQRKVAVVKLEKTLLKVEQP